MAKINGEQALGVEQVCKVLVRRGLMSKGQAKEVLSRQADLRKRLEKVRSMKRPSHFSSLKWAEPSITGIDIISSLNLERCDNPDKTLDEETIFQALAADWAYLIRRSTP